MQYGQHGVERFAVGRVYYENILFIWYQRIHNLLIGRVNHNGGIWYLTVCQHYFQSVYKIISAIVIGIKQYYIGLFELLKEMTVYLLMEIRLRRIELEYVGVVIYVIYIGVQRERNQRNLVGG